MRMAKVYITPLIMADVYGDEIDVSDRVKIDGIGKIKRSIDATDYTIGIYTFSDLTLKCDNNDGKFNENDSRSIFTHTRDKAIVSINMQDIDPITLGIISQIKFSGLINDEATRQNVTNGEITFKILSKDSILRTTSIPSGIVKDGYTAKQALFAILNQTEISNVLTIDNDNIEPYLDFEIDVASELDDLETKEALDMILTASGSCFLIRDDTVYIQERQVDDEDNVLNLYGPGEITGHCNIKSISEYNSGKHRQFNRVIVNGTAYDDSDSIAEYGLRKIEFDFPIVTNTTTMLNIGNMILEEFRYPKIELQLIVPTQDVEGYDILDLAKVDAPLIRKPMVENEFLPVYGGTNYGEYNSPYPVTIGSINIGPNIKFKILSIEEDPKLFTSTLKLRQFGKYTNDGTFIYTEKARYAEAIYGISSYSEQPPIIPYYGIAIYGTDFYGG